MPMKTMLDTRSFSTCTASATCASGEYRGEGISFCSCERHRGDGRILGAAGGGLIVPLCTGTCHARAPCFQPRARAQLLPFLRPTPSTHLRSDLACRE